MSDAEKDIELKKVTVVVPAYKEESIIEDTVDKITQAMVEISDKYRWELLLVDDGSRDNTGAIIDKLALTNDKIRVVHHKINYGIGKALKTGIKEASGDIAVVLDADLSYSTEHIARLLQKMEETDADIVSASCYAPGGKVENVPFKRAFMSRIGNALLSRAIGGGITVVTCIVMACKLDAIRSLDLVSDDKDINPEIFYKAVTLGLRIEEIPATLRWSEKKAGKSTRVRKSKFRYRKNTSTHLFILFWSRPFILFYVLGMIMFVFGLFEAGLLTYRFTVSISSYAETSSLYQSVILASRYIISRYTPTFILASALLVFGIQFLSLGFLAMQSQRNFNELYHLIHVSMRKEKQ